jgi:hypothetical protein
LRSEAALWKSIRPYLQAAKLDPVRVENPIGPGTPDVNFIGGWMELKSIEAWPVRDASIVTIKHFTPQQRVWLFKRWKYAPGTTHLLLEVRSVRQLLLFDGNVAALVVGKAPAAEHRLAARAVIEKSELGRLPELLQEKRVFEP